MNDRMRRFVRLGALGLCLSALSVWPSLSASQQERPGQGREDRRATRRAAEQRRAVSPRRGADTVEDTTSLVTPLRADSIKGAPRGAKGVVTLRTECMACHPTVHDVTLGRSPGPYTACLECHADSHKETQALYAGTVRGHDVHPDTMFLARVPCAGCHVDTTFAVTKGAARLAAYDRMCTSCHGERFGGLLSRWIAGLDWRERAVRGYVERASKDGRLGAQRPRARVHEADEVAKFLKAAGAIHNLLGADRLFRAALREASAGYAAAGVTAPALPALGPDPAKVSCLRCHYGVEGASKAVFGQTFDHATHLVRGNVACAECHSKVGFFAAERSAGPSAERRVDPRHGKTTITAAGCDGCHHSPDQKLGCAACHGDDARLGRPVRVTMALRLQPANAPTSRIVPFAHSDHASTPCSSCHTSPGAVRKVVACAECHRDHHAETTTRCSTCHGADTKVAHARDAHLRCTSCHSRETVAMLLPGRAFCVSCHTAQANHQPGGDCSTCHLQATPGELHRRMLAARP